MTRLSPTRRAFLRAMGAGMAALPFSRLLENSVAQAAGETLPLKFITIYHPHGFAAEFWAMKATRHRRLTFDISDTRLRELLAFSRSTMRSLTARASRIKILVIEGIDLLSNANGHDTAGTILTGSRIDGISAARRPDLLRWINTLRSPRAWATTRVSRA